MSNNLKTMLAFGVAGNFTGHLEQAGEISDFLKIEAKQNAPKAIFPVYIPNSGDYLAKFPFSDNEIKFPKNQNNEDLQLQIEPEIALISKIIYNEKQEVIKLIPKFFTAYNDCSIRKQGAKKISEKKNWGENSKGISSQIITLNSFDENSIINNYRIASFLIRDNQIYEYGINSLAKDYSYFNDLLLNWIVEKINTQKDQDPISEIMPLIKKANYPEYAIISIGATRYTEFGEKNYLKSGDISLVVVYDEYIYKKEDILKIAKTKKIPQKNISVLMQKIL